MNGAWRETSSWCQLGNILPTVQATSVTASLEQSILWKSGVVGCISYHLSPLGFPLWQNTL